MIAREQRPCEWRVGIDAGGTFVDLLAVCSDGRSLALKVPSTPDAPEIGPMRGIEQLVAAIAPQPLVEITHGTTVGLNALLERRFPRVALLVTRGFRHVLEIARHNVPGQWGSIYSWVKPQRVVPLEWVLEVPERIDASGAVVEPLDENAVRVLLDRVGEAGISTLGICLLHAYRNDQHERRIATLAAECLPGIALSVSSEIMPEFREYERMITTAMNAVLTPLVGQYLERFGRGAVERATPRAKVFVMRSAGGVVGLDEAARQPLRTALSGPAGGVLGMSRLARDSGYAHALTFDMGGTSADVAAVDNGVPRLTTEAMIDVYPLRAPTIDLVTIGAGGGSVIALGPGKRLLVGPRSAGASPGPACYGRGGTQPTVSDANLALGRLGNSLAGASVQLDRGAAVSALESVGAPLGLDAVGVARSALRIVAHNMAGAVRQVSVRRGIDPRRYVLVAFGGAGPLHAADLAALLEITTVLIPPRPGLGSCNGLLLADILLDDVRTLVLDQSGFTPSLIAPVLQQLGERLGARAANVAAGDVLSGGELQFRADLRYVGMGTELRVEARRDELLTPGIPEVVARFHAEHRQLFGYDYRERHAVQLLALRAALELPREGRLGTGTVLVPSEFGTASEPGLRRVWIDEVRGFETIPVLRRERLPVKWHAAGPLIVEQYDTTTYVRPDQDATLDGFGNLLLMRRHAL